MAGDVNQVMGHVTDKSKFETLLVPKNGAALHMLQQDVGLVDILYNGG